MTATHLFLNILHWVLFYKSKNMLQPNYNKTVKCLAYGFMALPVSWWFDSVLEIRDIKFIGKMSN